MKATTTPAPKQVRSYCILESPTPENAVATVRITQKGKAQNYHVNEFAVAPEMGEAGYEFSKGPSDEPYHVLLCHDGKAICDCRGFVRHNHCKHAALTPLLYRAFRQA